MRRDSSNAMNEAEPESYSSRNQTDRLCDFCNESKALLYCRADSAKLCFSCDREVHSTNPLFKKHNRSLLCDSCSSSPSSIFCCTESAVLCQNCDWEVHQNLGSIHDRRPVEGFSGCPSVSELLGFLGLEDLGKKSLDLGGGNDEGLLDLLVWETPSVVSLDDLIVSNGCDDDFAPGFQAIGVPPLPKVCILSLVFSNFGFFLFYLKFVFSVCFIWMLRMMKYTLYAYT